MSQSILNKREYEWLDYYKHFTYFSHQSVRDGCHPRIMEHEKLIKKAIVLVHGLSDSPYFMTAIADFFFEHLGYNVYLPLLQSHGLKEPKGMEDVKLDGWKANVDFAINTAASGAEEVSIGGLSTGGALSFYMAVNNPKITGTLYLFSAALDLAGGVGGIIGELKERLLRTFLADVLDNFENDKPLVGTNPYRYTRVDKGGAKELSKLIKETDTIIARFSSKEPFPRQVFAAHSESDSTADIAGIEALQKVSEPTRFTFFRIPKQAGVGHASLVLKNPIYAVGASDFEEPLEKANPLFKDMIEAIRTLG